MKDDYRVKAIEGHDTSATAGTVVKTPDAELPYKVVLAHENAELTEHPFQTIRECEAFIRLKTPFPKPSSTLFDFPVRNDAV